MTVAPRPGGLPPLQNGNHHSWPDITGAPYFSQLSTRGGSTADSIAAATAAMMNVTFSEADAGTTDAAGAANRARPHSPPTPTAAGTASAASELPPAASAAAVVGGKLAALHLPSMPPAGPAPPHMAGSKQQQPVSSQKTGAEQAMADARPARTSTGSGRYSSDGAPTARSHSPNAPPTPGDEAGAAAAAAGAAPTAQQQHAPVPPQSVIELLALLPQNGNMAFGARRYSYEQGNSGNSNATAVPATSISAGQQYLTLDPVTQWVIGSSSSQLPANADRLHPVGSPSTGSSAHSSGANTPAHAFGAVVGAPGSSSMLGSLIAPLQPLAGGSDGAAATTAAGSGRYTAVGSGSGGSYGAQLADPTAATLHLLGGGGSHGGEGPAAGGAVISGSLGSGSFLAGPATPSQDTMPPQQQQQQQQARSPSSSQNPTRSPSSQQLQALQQQQQHNADAALAASAAAAQQTAAAAASSNAAAILSAMGAFGPGPSQQQQQQQEIQAPLLEQSIIEQLAYMDPSQLADLMARSGLSADMLMALLTQTATARPLPQDIDSELGGSGASYGSSGDGVSQGPGASVLFRQSGSGSGLGAGGGFGAMHGAGAYGPARISGMGGGALSLPNSPAGFALPGGIVPSGGGSKLLASTNAYGLPQGMMQGQGQFGGNVTALLGPMGTPGGGGSFAPADGSAFGAGNFPLVSSAGPPGSSLGLGSIGLGGLGSPSGGHVQHGGGHRPQPHQGLLSGLTGSPGPARQHSLYKTELCRSWSESGSCRYGSKCQFAHGREELRPAPRHPKYKSELQVCRTFATTGTCPYGVRCRFTHEPLLPAARLRVELDAAAASLVAPPVSGPGVYGSSVTSALSPGGGLSAAGLATLLGGGAGTRAGGAAGSSTGSGAVSTGAFGAGASSNGPWGSTVSQQVRFHLEEAAHLVAAAMVAGRASSAG